MLQTEFIRSLHANYERVLLDRQPDEKRYQYCMISRGGIKGLLPCSLRYMNGLAYLYYDITSKQSVTQIYSQKCIDREWVKDFVWSVKYAQEEMSRFLLDSRNLLWFPEQIFQDPEKNDFSFFYLPYYEGDNGFLRLLEYLVEHIDYKDNDLVECVYTMYEGCEKVGDDYLRGQIYEDVKALEAEYCGEVQEDTQEEALAENIVKIRDANPVEETTDTSRHKGFFHRLERKKKKQLEVRKEYEEKMQLAMEGYAVAEESAYDVVEYGKTIYIDDAEIEEKTVHRIYSAEGKILVQLGEEMCTIGKKREKVNLYLEDYSVSRIHARIVPEGEGYFLEDLNSTNGTYKNGLRLQPYEKRVLEEGDEIGIGKVLLTYRSC